MKKTLYLIFILLICNHVKADVVIPDGYFKLFLKSKYPSCFYVDANSVEWLNTSCSSITSEDSLNMSDFAYQNNFSGDYLFNLEGIQYFTSLKYLNVKNHAIDSSPTLPASLIYADFSSTADYYFFTPFLYDVFPSSLRYLDCSNNTTSINSWPDSLRYLNCSGNWLYELPALPTQLDTLICSWQQSGSPAGNILSALPTLPLTLKYLDCSYDALESLPALPASLRYLDCSGNGYQTNPETSEYSLAALPSLPDGLQILKCGYNRLTALPALPSSLVYLDCSSNRSFIHESVLGEPLGSSHEGIDVLPVLPASLQYLNCSYNKLISLPALPVSLNFLDCSYNVYPGHDTYNGDTLFSQTAGITSLPSLPSQLTTLNCFITQVYCIPIIPASLTSLTLDHEKVNCLPNPGNYSVNGGPIPICSFFNNSNQCPIAISCIVSGNIYFDNNSNGIKDPGENYRPNVEVQLSNGLHAYTSDSGYYAMYIDTGSYTLTVINPSLYNATPAIFNYHFSSYNTTVHEMIPLLPTTMLDSVTVSIVPLNLPQVGFQEHYKITYRNVGTTTVSPSLVFNYDNSRLTYIGSSNAAVINNGNNLSLSETNFSPGTEHHFIADFGVNPTVALGDTLRANVIITAGTCIAKDSTSPLIIGPHDPNDKSATPSLTTQQVATGTYIDYVVRFQNTGTAPAIRVIVTDTLSSFLDLSTFKMVDASHTCRTIRNGNTLFFEFSNINLPDSNVNEPGSHGFIRFAVKPLTSVPLNTIIPNKADIYFDFNEPVETNIANTTIQLTTVPLSLLSFKAVPDANNNALLYWNTANEFNTSSFDIEQNIDGRIFNRIGTTAAHGRGNNTYSYKTIIPADIVYYRLKMFDIDRRFTYSQVLEVKKNKKAESIVVLSNPTKNTLSIITTDATLVNTTATIINEQGGIVKRFILKDGLQNIDVSNLSAGVYYLNTAVITNKIMINH
ncbi:MAG: hypothetical protein ABI402_15745 [Ferruginibacter sp.]